MWPLRHRLAAVSTSRPRSEAVRAATTFERGLAQDLELIAAQPVLCRPRAKTTSDLGHRLTLVIRSEPVGVEATVLDARPTWSSIPASPANPGEAPTSS